MKTFSGPHGLKKNGFKKFFTPVLRGRWHGGAVKLYIFIRVISTHIDLTRLGTDSGAADFLRSAHATDPSIEPSRVFFSIFSFVVVVVVVAGVGGMAEPLNPPHRCRCPGVSDQFALMPRFNIFAVTYLVLTCFRGGQPCHRLNHP